MQPEKEIREILQRYMNGECTAQEVALLERWYEMVTRGEEKEELLSEEEEERLVEELRKAVIAKEGIKNIRGWRVFRVAAVWIGLIVLTGWIWTRLYKRSPRASSPQDSFIGITTGYGEMRKVLLPDSSVVWLNSATHLRYHPDFVRHRELLLTGEAFFDVRHDVNHPFVVRSGNASTRVFGTAFNISAYAATGQLRISLQSGKVGVIYDDKAGKAEKILVPGQLFIYDKEAGTGQIEQQAPGEMDVWTAGRLLFYKTPLREAFAQIAARYGVQVVYDRELKNQTITARFENTALEKVLEHLSFGWDLHFTREGDTLRVR